RVAARGQTFGSDHAGETMFPPRTPFFFAASCQLGLGLSAVMPAFGRNRKLARRPSCGLAGPLDQSRGRGQTFGSAPVFSPTGLTGGSGRKARPLSFYGDDAGRNATTAIQTIATAAAAPASTRAATSSPPTQSTSSAGRRRVFRPGSRVTPRRSSMNQFASSAARSSPAP